MKTTREIQAQIFTKINALVQFSVSRYVLAIGLFLAIFAFGLISVLNLGVDQFPSTSFPFVVVTTGYPGASPSVVDQQVTKEIEDAVATQNGITDINSSSSLGSSQVLISFDGSTDQASDVNQVASLVSAALRRLPQGVESPIVQTFNISSDPILQFGVSSSSSSLDDVSSYVTNELTPMLQRVPGVANVQVEGGLARRFQVLLNPDRLQSFNLIPQQVVAAIAGSAINQPIGTIDSHNNVLTFATQNVPADTRNIAATLVDPASGVRVGDIAVVRDLSISTDYARVNGRPVVLISIQQSSSANAVTVARNVKKLLHGTGLPAGYEISFSNDTTAPIQASLDSTYREILITAIVVALIILLFLGKFNTAISVIIAIPIALSATPVLFNLAGFTLNLVSMLAMIVAIGIVVDDSIVVVENVERYRLMGFSQKEAVLKGASEVFSAVVAATLSLLSVLVPVSFIGGIIGQFMRQFTLGLAAAVAFSLLEAVLFLTVRLAYATAPKKSPALLKTLHGWTEAALDWVRERYAHSLAGILERSILVLVSTAGALVLIVLLILPKITFSFAPKSDSGSIVVDISMHNGTTLSSNNVTTGRLESYLLNQPAVSTVQTIVGSVGTYSVGVNRPENTTINIQLVPIKQRAGVYDLMDRYRKAMGEILSRDDPSATLSLSAPGGPPGSNSSISLSLLSSNQDLLQTRGAKILQFVQHHAFVTGATSSLSDIAVEHDFVPSASKMEGTGISPSTVSGLLQTYASGTQAGDAQVGGQNYPIMVQIDPTHLSDGQSLLNLPIYSETRRSRLQVGQLGSLVVRQSPISILRYNRLYTATLSIDLAKDAPSALSFQTTLTDELTRQGLLDSSLSLGSGGMFGASALANELATSGITAFLLAIFLAYLVMAAQFNSWRYPVYLLIPVPLAIVGALVFVVLLGGGLDIFGLLGVLLLIGLSAKNAILYLDFVVERIGKMPLKEALVESARLRFRPIVMTTLTILVISGPLVFSQGAGSEFGQRLGVVMFGGVFTSAILTFFVVPAAFYLFERKRVEKTTRVEERL